MHVAIIGGAGTVGASAGFDLAVSTPTIEISLVDVDADAARGHAIDLMHARTMRSLPQFSDGTAPVSIRGGTYESMSVADADCLAITASVPRPPNAAKRGGRAKFLNANREMIISIADQVADLPPRPTIIVTNPADRMAQWFWKSVGWPREMIMGYSLSETARTADWLSRHFDVAPTNIYCPVMGEHGEEVVPILSQASLGQEELRITEQEKSALRDYIRDVPYDVIQLRGEAETSRWVTGAGLSQIIRILGGSMNPGRPLCLSTPVDGQYGIEDVCVSVPVQLGSEGVEQIIEWPLADEELSGLHAAAESIKQDLVTS